MSFWQNVNPAGAIADLIAVYREAGRNRLRFAALSAAVTFGIFSIMAQESWKLPPAKPKITFITTFAAGRSDAEIEASNIANQKQKDELAAEQAKRDEDVREVYKTLGRASGMDVDAIEKQAQADSKAEATKTQKSQNSKQAPVAQR
jgi:hypothetical protein